MYNAEILSLLETETNRFYTAAVILKSCKSYLSKYVLQICSVENLQNVYF